MAKNDNLSDFMTDIANAIRAKKGTSEPINAQDFTAEIASIETGGGGGAMEYWSVPEGVDLGELLLFFLLIRIMSSGSPMVASALIYGWVSEGFFNSTLLAVAYDPTMKFISGGEVLTAAEMLAGIDFTTIGLTQITEEEFYSIN